CDDGVACNGEETCDELNDTCDAGTTTCGMGEVCDVPIDQCVTICPSFSMTPLALAGPFQQYGFCWYLGAAGQSCDQVCAALRGTNLANAAASAWPDHCGGAGSDDISYWYYHNGNAAGWGLNTGSTGYKTLGYGYTGNYWYGKCASGTSMNHGTFPGDPNDNSSRALVCPCR
ncbi:hypothetical protein KKD52_18320, partial [Myxococcota bacterium]|nr:hypothetical protein [Myxococcota bacterium]MBU1512311.1 hypothetical protein [Myxococcota bacterium]